MNDYNDRHAFYVQLLNSVRVGSALILASEATSIEYIKSRRGRDEFFTIKDLDYKASNLSVSEMASNICSYGFKPKLSAPSIDIEKLNDNIGELSICAYLYKKRIIEGVNEEMGKSHRVAFPQTNKDR